MLRSFLFIFLLLAAVPAFAADQDMIGTIMEVEGSAQLTPSGGKATPARVNDPVHLNDLLSTGSASRALVLFIDDTEIVLSENTQLRIDTYVFDSDAPENNKGIYSVLAGTFSYVSGLIAKTLEPDVTIETPAGSIGIRGTKFWGGDLDSEYNIYVEDGRIDLKNEAGNVTLDKGQATAAKGRKFAPRAPDIWDTNRIGRAQKTVALRNLNLVRQRIAQNRPRQMMLRRKQQEIMNNRRETTQKQKQQPQNNLRPTAPPPIAPQKPGINSQDLKTRPQKTQVKQRAVQKQRQNNQRK